MNSLAASEIRTIVFIGPSLSPEEALKIFPQAWIHAPAKCGDILKVVRLSPHRIAIIDGFFEQTASVWHKEILFALSLGIEVLGASSMGALRALELENFGMKGFGKIFQFLKETQSPDDDEVCLAHSHDFSAQTPPLCNIRATLDKALAHEVLSESEKEELIAALKNQPYFNRSFSNFGERTQLIKFCLSEYVDQKKEDAIGLLTYLRETPFSPPRHTTLFSPTLFFYKIFREITATPFEQAYSWLPLVEKTAVHAFKQPYAATQKRLTKLFHLCYDLARAGRHTAPTKEAILEWARERALRYPFPLSDQILSQYIELYDPFFSVSKTNQRLTLMLFKAVLGTLQKMDLQLNAEVYQQFSNQFRQTHQLLNQAQTFAWVQKSPLATSEDPTELSKIFNEFISVITPLYFLIDLNNGHYLNISPSLAAIPWLGFSEAKEAMTALEA